jgi:cell division protein FtsB
VVRSRRPPEPARYRYLRATYRGKRFTMPARVKWGIAVVALALSVLNFVGGDRGILRRLQLSAEAERLAAENQRLRLSKERLVREVELSEDDPLSLERVAREKYWMIGPDEMIYRFEDDDVVAEVPPAPEP